MENNQNTENENINDVTETSTQLMERLFDLRNENILTQSSNPFLRMINRSIEFIPQQFVINNLDNIIEQSINEIEICKKPTNKKFIETIKVKNITEETTEMVCSICMDTLKLNDKYISLPCDNDHLFHIESCENCEGILPWLNENNTCPICRYELPIEEPIEEPEKQEGELEEELEEEQVELEEEQGELEGEQGELEGEQGEQGELEGEQEIINQQLPFRLNRGQSDMLMSLIETHFNPVIIRSDPSDNGFSNMEIEEAIRRSLN